MFNLQNRALKENHAREGKPYADRHAALIPWGEVLIWKNSVLVEVGVPETRLLQLQVLRGQHSLP